MSSASDTARENFGVVFVLLVVTLVAWWRSGGSSVDLGTGSLSLDNLFGGLGWLSSLIGVDLIPSWMPQAVGWSAIITIAVALAAVAILAQSAVEREDVPDTGFAGSILSTIQTMGVLLGTLFFVMVFDSWQQAAFYIVGGGFVLGFAWIVWVYLQERRRRARQQTAIRHTQRAAERQLSEHVEVAMGFVVIFLTAVFAVMSGGLAALSGLGDAMLPFAPEVSYMVSTIIGYVSLGGTLPYDLHWLIPDLSAMQFLGISLLIGGIAIMVQQ